MEKKLNLLKILSLCPKGTKLYSPAFGYVYFYGLDSKKDKEDRNVICYSQNKQDEILFFYDGTLCASDDAECMLFPSKDNRDWSTFKIEKPKWNPSTLKPYDKVLVKDSETDYWQGDFYLFTDRDTNSDCPYVGISQMWSYCIPYNIETKHLLGTNQEAPEYYRV